MLRKSYRGKDDICCPYCDRGMPTTSRLIAHADACEKNPKFSAPVEEAAEQERAYEIASADVVLPLTLDDAHTIADGLELLADLDEGEHVDDDGLRRVAALVRTVTAETKA